MLMPFDELYTIDVWEFITTSQIWENTSFIEWKIKSSLTYPFISYSKIEEAVAKHISQRMDPTKLSHVTMIDRNNITHFSIEKVEPKIDENGEIIWDVFAPYYTIPTKIPLLQRYDIRNDTLWLVSEIKDKIVGLDKKDAKDIILTYDEVNSARISITPRWFSLIPEVKSRVNFRIE